MHYDDVFDAYVAARSPDAGVAPVVGWARRFQPGASILDLGCGDGRPIAEALRRRGFRMCGIDRSPRMVAAFRARLPEAAAACAPIETSDFFGRRFDAILAWGVLFLLSAADQERVIGRVARALPAGGGFLFTAPHAAVSWVDTFAGRRFPSVSLGAARYVEVLARHRLVVTAQPTDRWENDYYIAEKVTPPGAPTSGRPPWRDTRRSDMMAPRERPGGTGARPPAPRRSG